MLGAGMPLAKRKVRPPQSLLWNGMLPQSVSTNEIFQQKGKKVQYYKNNDIIHLYLKYFHSLFVFSLYLSLTSSSLFLWLTLLFSVSLYFLFLAPSLCLFLSFISLPLSSSLSFFSSSFSVCLSHLFFSLTPLSLCPCLCSLFFSCSSPSVCLSLSYLFCSLSFHSLCLSLHREAIYIRAIIAQLYLLQAIYSGYKINFSE